MLSIEAVRLNASTISLTLLFLAGFYLIYRDMHRIEDSIKRLDALLGSAMIPPEEAVFEVYNAAFAPDSGAFAPDNSAFSPGTCPMVQEVPTVQQPEQPAPPQQQPEQQPPLELVVEEDEDLEVA